MKLTGKLLLLTLIAAPFAANASGFDVAAGPTFTSAERSAAAAFASFYGNSLTDTSIAIEPIVTAGWVGPHSTHREHLHHSVFLAGGGVRFVSPSRHWFASEQLAATSRETDALSSRFEFMTSAGWQDGHFIVMVRHISNGHIVGGSPNLGETMLLAGVRW